ncbi:MAG: thiamine pyrophosphate-dependent dehydrogenase E1 component subunit alpha [Acidimicrobiales bacterium]|nr:thiamine pyrophosphate-dependent dehydrogenase E1 component subunit alpha [Acidimicrobiales bacterium]
MTSTPIGTTPGRADQATRVQMYEQMVHIRSFEKRVLALFHQGLVPATSHLSTGMEAIAVGVAANLRPGDSTLCTYRGHAHVLARGSSMEAMFAELIGRATGLLGGKGGSMHLASAEHGALGSYAIVGAHIPIAAGVAWSAQYRNTDQVVACFFGDGATNIGAFHEGLNLAAVWKLPVVFVCENNRYMEYTPIGSVTAVAHPAADRARAYGLEPVLIDGNDADVVFTAAAEACSRARAGDGPTLIEAETYRHFGHSNSDPAKYRPEAEVEEWLERDPITIYRSRLLAEGLDESVLTQIDVSADDAVEQAASAALAAPVPTVDEIEKNVWADGSGSWRS